jgi:hypothetical protein
LVITGAGRKGGYGKKVAVNRREAGTVYKSLFGADVGLEYKRKIVRGGLDAIVPNNMGKLQGLLLNIFKGGTE